MPSDSDLHIWDAPNGIAKGDAIAQAEFVCLLFGVQA
jgi:hypothetical protein